MVWIIPRTRWVWIRLLTKVDWGLGLLTRRSRRLRIRWGVIVPRPLLRRLGGMALLVVLASGAVVSRRPRFLLAVVIAWRLRILLPRAVVTARLLPRVRLPAGRSRGPPGDKFLRVRRLLAWRPRCWRPRLSFKRLVGRCLMQLNGVSPQYQKPASPSLGGSAGVVGQLSYRCFLQCQKRCGPSAGFSGGGEAQSSRTSSQ